MIEADISSGTSAQPSSVLKKKKENKSFQLTLTEQKKDRIKQTAKSHNK
jgi:hypothetical protein